MKSVKSYSFSVRLILLEVVLCGIFTTPAGKVCTGIITIGMQVLLQLSELYSDDHGI